MKSLEFNQISKEAVESLQPSFHNLRETSHKDGKYRLRRYSVVELRTTFWNAKREVEISHLPSRNFTQSEELNKFQGGMTRSFEDIEESVLYGGGMREACSLFKECNNLEDGQEVEIHQMRIITLNEVTQVSPEGIHQDGFDHIAMLGIKRHNVVGGELLVYDSPESEPFMVYELGNGDMAMLDDTRFWHNAKPLLRASTSEEGGNPHGYIDLFVFCTKV